MRGGSLRTPCEILAPAPVGTSESGEPRFRPESIGDLWCRITAIGGTRSEVASRLSPKATHSIAIRYTDRVKPGMAVRFHDDRVFSIDAILDHRDKRGDPGDPKIDLELLCSEGVLEE
jgi:SPP1 family predicted phage head-tail adaptor